MKVNETPQDKDEFKSKSELQKILYVTNDDGSYTKVNSEGWEVENLATEEAWSAVDETIKKVEAEVKAQKLSPIAYFMHKNLLDEAILAKYMGKWKWQVKRHLKPEHFKKLNPKTIEKYARVFNITIDELKDFGK